MQLIVIILALCSSAFAADEPAPLAEVKTWKELAAQPAIKLDGGGTVRLGIEALKAPLNGGVYVYCLADGVTIGDKFTVPLDSLAGPVDIRIESADPKALRREQDRTLGMVARRRNGADRTRALYAQSVPVSDVAGQIVTLLSPEKKVLATAKIEALPALLPPWMAFEPPVRDQRPQVEELQNANGAKAEYTANDYVVPAACGIALPSFEGMEPVLCVGVDGKRWPLNFADEQALPRFSDVIDESVKPADRPLQISYEKSAILAVSKRAFGNALFADRFLARWWVNGKAVDTENVEGLHARAWDGHVTMCHRARFELVQTLEALGAKKGDTIAVEFLFCPDGVRKMDRMKMLRDSYEEDGLLRVPERSNKIEFKAE